MTQPVPSTIYCGDCLDVPLPDHVNRGRMIAEAARVLLLPQIHAQPMKGITEVSLGSWYISAFIDLLAVTKNRLHAYEVKSNSDCVTRIPKQVVTYLGQAHSLTFIAEDKIAARVEKALKRQEENGWIEHKGKPYEQHCPGWPASELGFAVVTISGPLRDPASYRFEMIRPATEIMPANECFLLTADHAELCKHPVIRAAKMRRPRKPDMVKYLAAHITEEEAAAYIAGLYWPEDERLPLMTPEIARKRTAQRGLFAGVLE